MVNFRLHFNCIYNIFAIVHHKTQRANNLVLIIDGSYIPHLKGPRGLAYTVFKNFNVEKKLSDLYV